MSGGVLGALGLRHTETPAYVQAEQVWRDALDEGATSNPNAVFANLSPDELRARLESAARANDFTVISLTLLRPRGLAPLITVKATAETRFAEQVPTLLQLIDPKSGGPDSAGWAFEGLFLKAIDAQDEPFLVIYNHWRDESPGGGQWARSPDLLPFRHL